MAEPQRRPAKTVEQESLERLRRIETRITTLAIGMGVEMKTVKPVFVPGDECDPTEIVLPSPNTSLKEIMAAVPEGFTGQIAIVIGAETICKMDVPDRSC